MIEISYSTTFDEFKQANRLGCRLTPTIKGSMLMRAFLVSVGGSFLTALGAWMVGSGELAGLGIGLMFFGGLMLLLNVTIPLMARRASYSWNPMHDVPLKAAIADDAVSVASAKATNRYEWGAFIGSREGSKCIVLRLSPHSYVWFPKRAFSPEQLTELRNLIASKLGSKR